MFASYNKNDLHATRLGNWQEELALEELTGCANPSCFGARQRSCESWRLVVRLRRARAPLTRRHNRAPATSHPDFKGTYEKRVIEHRERVEVR